METGDGWEEQKLCEVGYWLCTIKEPSCSVWKGKTSRGNERKQLHRF